ncbi:M13-type metalloendopeptidase [Candidatus Cloacimonadota bacterium]
MIKSGILIILLIVLLVTYSTCLSENIFFEEKGAISDFYEYANKEWLSSSEIPENAVVLNNWGILWDRITDKSYEILAGRSNYDLDKAHLFVLEQLRNLYNSTESTNTTYLKRVNFVQKQFPILFGVLFSRITVTMSKEDKINELIHYLTLAYKTKIKQSNKVSDYYENLFLSKLEKMKFEVGAPDLNMLPDVPALSENDLEENLRLAEEYQVEISKYGIEWNTPPHETDCFFYFNSNKMKIYAGILFDEKFEDDSDFVYLYSTIGRTIAHEMTHAFDGTGLNFDENGKRISWFKKLFSGVLFRSQIWKTSDLALINQFSGYSIQDSMYVNGENTLQENFADLGGFEISLAALKIYIQERYPLYSEEETSAAISRFYIYFAQFWREKTTPEFELASLKRMHTPQKFRAIGPVYNQDEFYLIFDIDKLSEYYIPKEQRISIW